MRTKKVKWKHLINYLKHFLNEHPALQFICTPEEACKLQKRKKKLKFYVGDIIDIHKNVAYIEVARNKTEYTKYLHEV